MVTGPATYFGRAAAEYARGRPGYPQEAVDWMLEGVDGVVLDLGAGTGKLTEAVLHSGHRAVAVDPDPVMLATFELHVPGVTPVRGSAERIPLEDASVDAVVVGQAWHWFDAAAASAEIARVLRPGGRLGLIWNVRDETVDWVVDLTRVIGHSAAERLIEGGGPRVPAPFSAGESREWPWRHEMTAASMRAFVHSRSDYIGGTGTLRADVDQALDAFIARTPGLADGGTVALPYVAHAHRTDLP